MVSDADPWLVAPRTYRRLRPVEQQYVAFFYRDWLGDRRNLQDAEVDDAATGPPVIVARRMLLLGTWNAWELLVLPPLFVAALTYSLIRLGDHAASTMVVAWICLAVGPGSVSVVERVEYGVIAAALGQEIIWRMWKETKEAREAFRWLIEVDPAARPGSRR